jgi:peptidoglycan hydrolase CwlO-like protein
MSEAMNTPSTGSPLQPMQPQQPNKNNTWIYLGIIAILLGTCIYLFTSRNSLKEQLATTQYQFNEADSSRRAVESDYQAALVRLDELVSKNNMMDSIVNDQNSEIAKLKAQIKSIVTKSNATKEDLGKAKRLIAKLNSKVKGYEERIAELEKANSELTDQNNLVTKERDNAVTENIGLKQKAKLGAVLHISNIRMSAIDLRRGGKKEKETSRAGKVDLMRITFDIDENRVAESGKKQIYLIVKGPDGAIMSSASSGSVNDADGNDINYTLVKEIDLQTNQPVKDVSVDWHQDTDYAKGTYTIDLYNDGYKVGSGTVNLR